MEINMRLHPEPFENIKSGLKKIECRLKDEKRSSLQVGDFIIFISRVDPEDTIKTKIVDIKLYESFEDLYDNEIEDIQSYYKGTKKEFVDGFLEYYPRDLYKETPPMAIHIEKV